MSVHRLSAGSGFRYLLRDTASSDVHRGPELPLTEYYAASGNPPGRWAGAGLAGLAGGHGVPAGTLVSESAMSAVFGHAADPVTREPLGRAFPNRVDADGVRRPSGVAGFDLTFTVPKSVSVLWALGDQQTRTAIVVAHHAAIDQVLEMVEHRVLATRVGHAGLTTVATRGAVAAAFDHPDTRSGDPNLHTHLVVANRVQGPDRVWRAIDAQPLFAAAVTLSETYDALVTDELARRLPVAFGWRDRGERRTPAFEVDGIDDRLLALFSTRSAAISTHLQDLVTAFTVEHGRGPSRVETTRLRQTATLATRPAKKPHAWSELFTSWGQRASALTGRSPRDLIAAAIDGQYTRPLRASDIGPVSHRDLAALAVVGVQERRSTWNAWNLEAEIARLTKPLTMATPKDRARLHAAVLKEAVMQCVPLHEEQIGVDRWTGMRLRWTSTAILDAEAHLLEVAQVGTAPRVHPRIAELAEQAFSQPGALPGSGIGPLAPDQAAAMVQVCTSGRALEVLVGPAGSGKTATLTAIRAVWNTAQWTAGVVGLAPSATAAQQLSMTLGVRCETTAKWLHETTGPAGQARLAAITALDLDLTTAATGASHRYELLQRRQALVFEQSKWQLEAGQLLVVDEATLAGTLDLDHLTTQAQAAGAKILLVGDQHQLSSVQAGGAFGLLARRTQTAELTGLWRFANRWEAHATRLLRTGDLAALDAYHAHDRLHSGTRDAMLDSAYQAWRRDTHHGLDAVLIATDQATVNDLNSRARTDAVLAGAVDPHGVALREGTTAGVGDTIITRHNDRTLRLGDGDHVRNGTTWTVTAAHPDGSITAGLLHAASRTDPKDIGNQCTDAKAQVLLPAEYVGEHVDLGYAITAQRVQSRTHDTAHVITGPDMSREHLYVALTRGRHANHAYTPLDVAPGVDFEPHQSLSTDAPMQTGRELLTHILATSSAEPSATDSLDSARYPQPDPRFVPRPQDTHERIDTNRPRVPDGPGLYR